VAVVTASSRGLRETIRRRTLVLTGRRQLIRQASVWLPSEDPQPARLQDLEESSGIRWVDLNGGSLGGFEAQALLDPVCHGELRPRMVRDLVSAGRYPAGRRYDAGQIAISAAFRTRHVRRNGGRLTSVFEPVHLLVGEDWLLTCWLPPRTYRGTGELGPEDDAANELYLAVASAWRDRGQTAADLAELVRQQLGSAGERRPVAN